METITRRYPATRAAVADVRADVATYFAADTADDARLLASELAQNAVRYGTGNRFTVTVATGHGQVTVTVISDGSAALSGSSTAFPDLDAEGGRGLPLLAALAAAYGIDSRGGRTSAWFTLPAPLTAAA